MLIVPLPAIVNYVQALNNTLKERNSDFSLSRIQCLWFSTVLTGIVVTGKLSWALFERRSLGAFGQERLRWMFISGAIAWLWLFYKSVLLVLKRYGITEGVLVIDDTVKKRAKKTKKIPGAHKIKDKATGGYVNGQELIFLLLVTDTITIPVGFCFYEPDPKMSLWRKKNNQLKKKGVPVAKRPVRPKPNPAYPTKQTLALCLIKEFQKSFSYIEIKALLVDSLYSDQNFMGQAEELLENTQIISRLRHNQNIHYRGKKVKLRAFFSRQSGVKKEITIRGGEKKTVLVQAARLHVQAHGKKRFIVAIKYEGETDYRFLVASNLSWHHEDIIRVFTLRWLIEVFIQDWKQYGGWNKLAKHQSGEGSMRGVILSLLCDHMLLLEPEQLTRLKNKQPGMPTGCQIEQLKAAALIQAIQTIMSSINPQESFKLFAVQLKECLPERQSSKHMAGRDLGRMEPSPSLKYKNSA